MPRTRFHTENGVPTASGVFLEIKEFAEGIPGERTMGWDLDEQKSDHLDLYGASLNMMDVEGLHSIKSPEIIWP